MGAIGASLSESSTSAILSLVQTANSGCFVVVVFFFNSTVLVEEIICPNKNCDLSWKEGGCFKLIPHVIP